MTMPSGPTKVIELPQPGYPMLTLLVTDNFLEEGSVKTLHWSVGKKHPFVPDVNIMRMFVVDRGGVEIYSVSSDGKAGMRDFVPMPRVRLAQEAMPLDVFVEELVIAESGGDDDPDDPDDPDFEPDRATQPPQVVSTDTTAPMNGQGQP